MVQRQRLLFPLSVLSFCLCSCQAKLSPHERTKRHLSFPNGAAFTVTVAMSTFLPKDTLPELVPTGLAHIVEYDFGYRLPPSLYSHKHHKKEPPIKKMSTDKLWTPKYSSDIQKKWKWKQRRRGRLLNDISSFISMQGYDGAACVIRLNCEAQEHITEGGSLLEDILQAILPKEEKNTCDYGYKYCLFSPLSYVMHSNHID